LKKTKKVFVAITLVLLCLPVFICLDFLFYIHRPIRGNQEQIDIIIYPGQGSNSTLKSLESSHIVTQPDKFRWYARLRGFDKKLKAGEYSISPSMSPAEILQMMISGRVKLHKLTIPEGYNLRQIALVVEQSGLGSEQKFIELASDTHWVHEMGIDADTFEGYLFPETYYFSKGVTEKEIISAMVNRFQQVFTSDWEARARDLDFTVHEIVTLASIIEKETGADFERPIISSVFHNRLKRGMRLETDPTVIYGLKQFNGNLTRKHLLTPSAYNTYLNYGLPPGPIANPGRAALEAALFPANTNYLYFVSKKNHTHQFSTNLKDHNAAVRKYQLRR